MGGAVGPQLVLQYHQPLKLPTWGWRVPMPPVLATHFKHGDCLKTVPALLVEEAFRKVWAWRPARPEPAHHPKYLQQEQQDWFGPGLSVVKGGPAGLRVLF